MLVAFAIEFDNEFEARMLKSWARPFRVSIVMWSDFMRFVREPGTPFGEIVGASRLPKGAVASVVGGMERWGYVTVDHDPAQGVPPVRKGFGTGRGLRNETVIYPSMVGQVALDRWNGLDAEIEGRWNSRLGRAQVENLRGSLRDIEHNLRVVMPHFLPVVGGGGMFANADLESGRSEPDETLPTLLSRVLLAFTIEAEKDSPVSLPIGANLLRVLDLEEVTKVRDLPLATGTSKEAVSWSMTWLERSGYISVDPDPNARGKVARVTQDGAAARAALERRIEETETDWEKRFGGTVSDLRGVLQDILDQPGGEAGPLSSGLVTPAGGWRATGRYKPLTAGFIQDPAEALPAYPVVLHRGGWPDGS